MERTRKEKPAFLTITSLELPDSPIPLIEFQASARSRVNELPHVTNGRDDILDEFIENISTVGKDRQTDSTISAGNVPKRKQYFNTKNKCRIIKTPESAGRKINDGLNKF